MKGHSGDDLIVAVAPICAPPIRKRPPAFCFAGDLLSHDREFVLGVRRLKIAAPR